jgi:hypothetical protein
MTSAISIDRLLVLAVGAWLLQVTVILVARVISDWRIARIRRLHAALCAVETQGNPGAALSSLARRLRLADFEPVTRLGLPVRVEVRLAEKLRDRLGAERMRRRAGADRGSIWRQVAALQVLAACRDPFIYARLDAALRSGRPRVATAALGLLTRLNDRAAADVLLRALRAGTYTRSRVAAAFERLTVERAPMLATLLNAPDPGLRAWGVRLTANLFERQLSPLVRRLAGDSDAVVRRTAVEALGRIGDPGDGALLLPRLLDASPIVRAHAARALVSYPDEETLARVADCLADRDWIVRLAARDTLGAHPEQARGAMLKALWTDDRFAAENAAGLLVHSGVAEQAARWVLRSGGADSAVIAVVRRLLTVGNASIRAALLRPFAPADREVLLHVAGAAGSLGAGA